MSKTKRIQATLSLYDPKSELEKKILMVAALLAYQKGVPVGRGTAVATALDTTLTQLKTELGITHEQAQAITAKWLASRA